MIRRELPVFLIVGLTGTALDFLLYRSLLYFSVTEINQAKFFGCIAGTMFAYFANQFWTFNQKTISKRSIWRFCLIYALGISANVVINQGVLLIWGGQYVLYIAFIVATLFSAILNFIGMKFFVFTDRPLKLRL